MLLTRHLIRTLVVATILWMATTSGVWAAGGWYGTTLAGAPPSNPEPFAPNAYWERPDGSIWVSEQASRIGLWTADGTFVVEIGSISGTAPGQFRSPVGIAGSPDSTTMYVLDQGARKLKRYSADGVYISEWGVQGNAACQMNVPYDVDVAPDGSVLTIDANRWINRWSADGATCQASYVGGGPGSGPGQFSGPRGIAVDGSGRIYVADSANNRIQRLSAAGAYELQWGSTGTATGQFTTPIGIDVDRATGTVYVEEISGRVQVFDQDGAFLRSFGGSGFTDTSLITGQGIEYLSGGRVAVGDVASHRGLIWDATTGAFVQRLGTAPLIRHAVHTAVDVTRGVVYIPLSGEHRVLRVALDGTELSSFGTYGAAPGQFSQPRGVAVAPDGRQVYVVDSVNHRVQRFDPSGTYLGEFGGPGSAPGQMSSPRSAGVDPTTGDVLVVDGGNHRIQRFSATGTFISTFGTVGTADAQLSGPSDLDVDATGVIWVADANNCKIKRFDANGTFLSGFTACGGGDRVTTFSDLGVAPDGTVWTNDSTAGKVVHFDMAGTVLEHIGSDTKGTGSEQLFGPRGITVLANDSLLVVDNSNMRVQWFRTDTAAPTVAVRSLRGAGTVTFAVDATDAGAGLAPEAYSFDGGASFQAHSSTTVTGLTDDVSPTVTVVVRDRLGTASAPLTLTVDRVAPVVTVVRVQGRAVRTNAGNRAARLWFDLTASDAGSGVRSVSASFQGKRVRVTVDPASPGTFRIGPLPEGRGTIRITVTDADGNERTIERAGVLADYTPPRVGSAPRIVFGRQLRIRTTDALSGVVAAPRVRLVVPRLGRQALTATTRDRAGNVGRQRVVVERRLSLANPRLNADVISKVTYPLVASSFAFHRDLDGWYRPDRLARPLVIEAQRRLQEFGHLSVVHQRGTLDIATIRAVIRFQASVGLPRLGTIGPRTRAALDRELLRRG